MMTGSCLGEDGVYLRRSSGDIVKLTDCEVSSIAAVKRFVHCTKAASALYLPVQCSNSNILPAIHQYRSPFESSQKSHPKSATL